MPPKLTKQTQEKIKRHFLKCYPEEGCGVIVKRSFVPLPNTHEEPTKAFRIAADDYAQYVVDGTLTAVVHSHCIVNGQNTPSIDARTPTAADQKGWIETAVPWAIYATNGENVTDPLWLDDSEIPPLVEREFIHGIQDCYSIIRDYYRLQGITLKNYPRGWQWWENGDDLYSANFEDAGFYEIQAHEVKVGDVALFRVAAPVINHAAIVTGENEITHHLFHRLSTRDTLAKWARNIVKYIRYKG